MCRVSYTRLACAYARVCSTEAKSGKHHLFLFTGMKKKGSWFSYGRQGQNSTAVVGGSSSDEAAGSSAAATGRSERSPMLQLFSGQRSDGDTEARGGLLSSLVKNK